MHCLFFVEFSRRLTGKRGKCYYKEKDGKHRKTKGAIVMLKPEVIGQLADQIWEAERKTTPIAPFTQS